MILIVSGLQVIWSLDCFQQHDKSLWYQNWPDASRRCTKRKSAWFICENGGEYSVCVIGQLRVRTLRVLLRSVRLLNSFRQVFFSINEVNQTILFTLSTLCVRSDFDSVFWVYLSLFVDIITHHYKLKARHMRLEKLRTPVNFDFDFVFEKRHMD